MSKASGRYTNNRWLFSAHVFHLQGEMISMNQSEYATTHTSTGQLWMAIHIAELALSTHSRAVSEPTAAVLLDKQGAREQVWQCNQLARDAGIEIGMTLAAALALCDTLTIFRRDLSGEQLALSQLADWAGQFSSVVSLQAPDTLLLEVKGSLIYFGGAKRLWKRVAVRAAELGYQINLAVTPSPAASALFATEGQACWLSDRQSLLETLPDLSVCVLESAGIDYLRLESMGIKTLGECFGLPRDGLRRRFGADFIEYIDRLRAMRPDPRLRHQPKPRYHGRIALPAPAELTSALLFVGKRLIHELVGSLRALGMGAQTLNWRLQYERGQTALTLHLVEPTRDPERLISLLQTRLEQIDLQAPVIEMMLVVDQFFELEHIAEDFWNTGARQANHSMLLNRLAARLGQEAVTGMCLWPDHRPEKAWRECAPGDHTPLPVQQVCRPSWLLSQPKKLLCTTDGKPCWQGVLSLQQGPERIQTGWWDGYDIRRDYFIAHNPTGQRVWIFCEASHRGNFQQHTTKRHDWYLHGIFA